MTRAVELPDDDYDLSDYDDQFLDCRDHGHSWDVLGKWRDLVGDWNRRLRCRRCRMTRQDRYVRGSEVRRSYSPPEGYYLDRRIDRWSFKAESLDRTPTFTSEAELEASLTTTPLPARSRDDHSIHCPGRRVRRGRALGGRPDHHQAGTTDRRRCPDIRGWCAVSELPADDVRPCYDCGDAWDGYAIWPEHHRPPRSGADMVYLCRPCCDRRGLRENG